ncbi:MAG: nucleotide exchange factor GrpE, partial [Methylotenera sp.]
MQQDQENQQQDQQPTASQTSTEQAAATPETRITELEAALEEAKANVLYIKAEGENIRRRAMEDIDKARKFALEKFSNELLAVKDSLDAALL